MPDMARALVRSAVLAGVAVWALEFPGPRMTQMAAILADMHLPRPTQAPIYRDFRAVRKRASTSDTTVLVAPDNTCGFVSGLPGESARG